ncbi:hypothetical protein D5H75_18815 [Bailinhaonella thermotolerans]|uniref:Uncharacterized protein n=2 Tax=Bailinhaonella thermotolerans TaxID=1070861 RepID=A0A3A4AT40_9ACTN|nr:hypothetical protein D5H75_18815 [Bailinhaonella thermotolerans]
MDALREQLAAHGLYVKAAAVRLDGDTARLRLGDQEVTATTEALIWDGHAHPAEQVEQVAKLLADAYTVHVLGWLKSACPGWRHHHDAGAYRATWLAPVPEQLRQAGFRAEVAAPNLVTFARELQEQHMIAHMNGH